MPALTQRLTASLGGRAGFWRGRRYLHRRWFGATRWFFGTRHLASEANAYLISGRYLLRKCALPIVLAALAVVAIHFVETSWTALLSDLGLAHTRFGDALARPVDRATYAVLLQSVAAVTGVFLALYFTAVSTVAATVYTEVPHDIRNLMLRDKLGNFYVRVVAFLSALALFLLVEEASGGAAYHLALPLVALLAGFAVFAFITLGQRAFYFSDPTVLSQLVVGDFQRWFSDATAGGWRWTDPSFQEHYRKQARRTLGSLVALLEFSQTHDFVRDDSERSVLSWILVVLRAYVGEEDDRPDRQPLVRGGLRAPTVVPVGVDRSEHGHADREPTVPDNHSRRQLGREGPTRARDHNGMQRPATEPRRGRLCDVGRPSPSVPTVRNPTGRPGGNRVGDEAERSRAGGDRNRPATRPRARAQSGEPRREHRHAGRPDRRARGRALSPAFRSRRGDPHHDTDLHQMGTRRRAIQGPNAEARRRDARGAAGRDQV